MEMYLVKSAACLAVLLLFYKLLLEKENMHIFKRYYLIISALAAIAIPLITLTTYVEPASENLNALIYSSEASPEVVANNSDYLPNIFFGIYLLGVLFFSIKFFRNLRSLILKIITNPKLRSNSFINVLLSEKIQPHTFFSFIFFNKEKYLQDEIPQDVKIHEEAHARQKHSLDVLLVELLQIIFWFNPLIFLLKDAVKLNHEFLADREVIRRGKNISRYQQTLLAYSSQDLQCDLVNPINYSSIKKRFTVMKTKTSRKAIWTREILLVPLLAVLFYSFSTKEVKERNAENLISEVKNSEILELRMDQEGNIFLKNERISLAEVKDLNWNNYTNYTINISPDVSKTVEEEFVALVVNQGIEGTITVCAVNDAENTFSQEKATPEMVEEYNKMAKHYSLSPGEGAFIKTKDYDRMKYIYNLMTPEQKRKSESFPVPSPPPPPNKNMVAEYNRLVKHYNELPEDKQIIKQKDLNKINFVLSTMTPEQKKNAEKINFNLHPSLPPAPVPEPENSWVSIPAFPPPPPPPPTFEGLVEKGATFYYNGKIITPEEAQRLVSIEKKVNVQVTDIDTKPIVKLTDKEKK